MTIPSIADPQRALADYAVAHFSTKSGMLCLITMPYDEPIRATATGEI